MVAVMHRRALLARDNAIPQALHAAATALRSARASKTRSRLTVDQRLPSLSSQNNMAGLGRRTNYRKSVQDDYLNGVPEPDEDQSVARALGSR
jgi:hypothetical protein